LGINNSKLNNEEFDTKDQFNSKYNRFFRSAVLYGIKTFFPQKKVIVENIYHEQGQQKEDDISPGIVYTKLGKRRKISFQCEKIEFLPKDPDKTKGQI
jgi:hypothetical protein